MLHTAVIWLLIASLLGAGVANMFGGPATRANFARWGYPAWWCRFTGALEVADAILIAVPATRLFALFLGAAIILAALVTIIHHRELSHLLPLGAFVVLLGLTAFLP